MRDRKQVYALVEKFKTNHPDLILVSGGCHEGADAYADEASRIYNVPIETYRPDFAKPAKYRAEPFFARNRVIVEKSDVIYAWISDDRTGGTENTLSHARDLKKDAFVVTRDGSIYLDSSACPPATSPHD